MQKYYNPRITFDGLNWWICAGIEYGKSTEYPLNQGIGMDIGIKELAIYCDKRFIKISTRPQKSEN